MTITNQEAGPQNGDLNTIYLQLPKWNYVAYSTKESNPQSTQ